MNAYHKMYITLQMAGSKRSFDVAFAVSSNEKIPVLFFTKRQKTSKNKYIFKRGEYDETSNKKRDVTTLAKLPNELLIKIASFMSIGNIGRLAQTSKRFNHTLAAEVHWQPIFKHNDDIIPALLNAAEKGGINAVKKLTDMGADIDTRVGDKPGPGERALTQAVEDGRWWAVAVLLEDGADATLDVCRFHMKSLDERDISLLGYCAFLGGFADPEEPHAFQDDMGVYVASLLFAYYRVEDLIVNTGSVLPSSHSLSGILGMAAFAGKCDLCRLLIAKGDDPHFVLPTGISVMQYAIEGFFRSSSNIVKLFGQHGVVLSATM